MSMHPDAAVFRMGSLFGFIWCVVTKSEVKIELTNSSSQPPPKKNKQTLNKQKKQWKQTNKIPPEDQEVVICKWQMYLSWEK